MKLHWTAALPIAAALLLTPGISRAQSGPASSGALASDAPAVVVLPHGLNSKKLSVGQTVETRLDNDVHLSNGTELPKGTPMIAQVVNDDMSTNGQNKLALRFTEARPKHGQAIPVRATIIGASTKFVPVRNNPNAIEVIISMPDNLNNQPDEINQLGIRAGVDLHSKASSDNSGVFVTNKDNIDLPAGSKFELAIAPRS